MNRIFLLIAIGFIAFDLTAQTQVENILRDAKTYNKAYLDNDFDTFTKMTIPSIVKLAGGAEIMTKVSKEHYKTMLSGGMKFISITPMKPSKIMLAGDDLHTILPQEVLTESGDEEFKRTVYYLASSNDDGKTWTFVDLEPYDSESIKLYVPNFSGELEIPAVEFAKKVNN